MPGPTTRMGERLAKQMTRTRMLPDGVDLAATVQTIEAEAAAIESARADKAEAAHGHALDDAWQRCIERDTAIRQRDTLAEALRYCWYFSDGGQHLCGYCDAAEPEHKDECMRRAALDAIKEEE
jgi:hypothetical protein